MDPEDLKKLIPQCPLRIELSSGAAYVVEKPDLIVISDYQAAILADFEGVKRIVVIGLINVASVVPFGATAEP